MIQDVPKPSPKQTVFQIILGVLVGAQSMYGIGGLLDRSIDSSDLDQMTIIGAFPLVGLAIIKHALWARYQRAAGATDRQSSH